MRFDLLNSKFGSQKYLFSGKREYSYKSKELCTQCDRTVSAWECRPVRMEHSREEKNWTQKLVMDTFINHGKSQEMVSISQAMILSRNIKCLYLHTSIALCVLKFK